MRISDWSSDVCSSDLLLPLAAVAFAAQRLAAILGRPAFSHQVEPAAHPRVAHHDFRQAEDQRDDGDEQKAENERPQLDQERGIQHRIITSGDRKSPRLNSSHYCAHRMPSSASKKKTYKEQRLTQT